MIKFALQNTESHVQDQQRVGKINQHVQRFPNRGAEIREPEIVARCCHQKQNDEREKSERTRLLETLADFDDDLMEALLMDEQPDQQMVMADLAIDTAGNKVVPVILGSALAGGASLRGGAMVRDASAARCSS